MFVVAFFPPHPFPVEKPASQVSPNPFLDFSSPPTGEARNTPRSFAEGNPQYLMKSLKRFFCQDS